MNLKRVRSLMICVLPFCLPLLAACNGALDESAEGTDTGEGPTGVAAQAATRGSVSPIAGGNWSSLSLKSDGTVWAWGYNSNGQLGDGTTTDRAAPVQVSGLSGITAVSAGEDSYSLALKSDGTVWAWGSNIYHELGAGVSSDQYTPVQVLDLSGVTAVAAAVAHSLALKSDGTVWAWGLNSDGELGDGTTINRTTPVQVSGLSNITAVSAENGHSLALRSDGTVWAWGSNNVGQLGDGTTTNRTTPVQVGGLSGVTITALAAGWIYSLALASDGTVWAWGSNNMGQLGDGTTTNRTTPVQVGGLSGVTAVASAYESSLALKSDGTVWAWVYNTHGELGDGTTSKRPTPVHVRGLSGVRAVAAGDRHGLAQKSDGTVWAWGVNSHGQLGDGTTTERHTPVLSQAAAVADIAASMSRISAGGLASLALAPDGTVWSSGDNTHGQLGDGTTTQRTSPVQVGGLSSVTAVSAGYSNYSLALRSDGTLWSWGSNLYGQLGIGDPSSLDDETTPVQVLMPASPVVTAVAAANAHALAVLADGTVWGFGINSQGQLGQGTSGGYYYDAPVQVLGVSGAGVLSGITAVAGGSAHSLALSAEGTVLAFGANAWGQLGDGTTTDRSAPVQVGGLSGITAVAATWYASYALRSDGTVWAWGDTTYQEVGECTPAADPTTPAQVAGLSGIVAVAAGEYDTLALKSDGTVWGWGSNPDGELGTTGVQCSPVQVSGLSGIAAVTMGQFHALALRSDGTVLASGGNFDGQLGDGTTTNRTTPVASLLP